MGIIIGSSYANLFVGYIDYNGPKKNLIFTNVSSMTASVLLHPAKRNSTNSFFFFFHLAITYTCKFPKIHLLSSTFKLSVNGNALPTSIHYKPTGSYNNYLLHSSSHPQHGKKKNAIQFSQFLRLRYLCSEESDFNGKCEELVSFSKKRGYPDSLSPQANNVPKKSIEKPHYKRHRTKKPTESHSPSSTIHKTLQSKMSFSKPSKFSAVIPKAKHIQGWKLNNWTSIIHYSLCVLFELIIHYSF